MMDAEQIWQDMLSILEVEVNTLGFDVWIKPLRPLGIEDGILVLVSPTSASKSEVVSRYMPLLKGALRRVDGAPSELTLISEDERDRYSPRESEPKKTEKAAPVSTSHASNINPKYNFENFVVGGCNKLAHAAAQAVAENPGTLYNPLFIYGGVGLGKTHIMHAIGNAVRMSMSNLKIVYVSSKTFINEFIDSIRTAKGANQDFRDKYRGVDLLMIDDVQFISKKPSTQEEIFHTFEELQNAGKQMVFASYCPPQEIPYLDARVKSRFASSLVVDIQPPDLETRIAILQHKSQEAKTNIPANVLEYIAENVSSNIREMEGVLTKVIFLAKLSESRVDMDICKQALGDYRVQTCEEITADEIIDYTCKYFNIAKADVIGKKKNKEIVEARQIAMYLIYDMLSLPMISVGQFFGGKEHTTVLHARDRVVAAMANDEKTRTAVGDIKAMILRK